MRRWPCGGDSSHLARLADLGRASRDCLVTLRLVCRKRLIARCSSLPPPRGDRRSRLGRQSSPRGNLRRDVARNSSALPRALHSSPLLPQGHGEARSCTEHPANVSGFSPGSGVISSASPHLPPTTPFPPCYKNPKYFLQPCSSSLSKWDRGEGLLNSNADVCSGRAMLKVLLKSSPFKKQQGVKTWWCCQLLN